VCELAFRDRENERQEGGKKAMKGMKEERGRRIEMRKKILFS
jgi:hypothetical protein